MAYGRPRRRNDPSVMASVESALSTTVEPGILSLWYWRYELLFVIGLPAAVFAISSTLGIGWLIAIMVIGITLLAAAMLWSPSRKRLIARAWCVITPHRVRTGCTHSWVQTRNGRLPVVLYTRPIEAGERVMLWCRAGITAEDLEAACDVISVACWAREVRVLPSERHRHLVALEVIRRDPAGGPAAAPPSWPYLPQSETDGPDPEEPATSVPPVPVGADR
jgi:hypothetical protein